MTKVKLRGEERTAKQRAADKRKAEPIPEATLKRIVVALESSDLAVEKVLRRFAFSPEKVKKDLGEKRWRELIAKRRAGALGGVHCSRKKALKPATRTMLEVVERLREGWWLSTGPKGHWLWSGSGETRTVSKATVAGLKARGLIRKVQSTGTQEEWTCTAKKS